MKFAKNKKQLEKQEKALDKMYQVNVCDFCGQKRRHKCISCGTPISEIDCMINKGECFLCSIK